MSVSGVYSSSRISSFHVFSLFFCGLRNIRSATDTEIYVLIIALLVAHRAGFFYRSANEVWGKVMFLHLSVNLFTRWGVSAPLHTGIHTPPGQTPLPPRHTLPWQTPLPQADNPPGQTPPTSDTTGYGQQASWNAYLFKFWEF